MRRAKRYKKHRGIFGFVLAGLSAAVSATLVVIMALTACDYINIIPEWVTVNFYYDRAHTRLLQSKKVLEFTEAKYDGPPPSKDPDGRGAYMFFGWSRILTHVWRNTDTHALFVPLSFFDFGAVGDLPEGFYDMPREDVMMVTTSLPSATYLRQRSYGDYKSGIWSDNVPKTPKDLSQTFTNPLNYAGYIAMNNAPSVGYDISIDYAKPFEYTPLPQYTGNKIDSKLESSSDAYVKYQDVTGSNHFETKTTFIEPIKLPATLDNLKKNSNLTPDQKEELKQYKKFAEKNYLNINPDVYDFIKDMVIKNNIKITDGNVFSSIQRAISSRLEFDPTAFGGGFGQDPMLKAFDKGIANQTAYATACTLMLRYLKIPARYCTGYVAFNPYANQPTPVTNFQISAWTEAFVDNVGWVNIDTCLEDFYEFLKKHMGIKGDVTIQNSSKVYDGKPFDADDVVKLSPENLEDISKRKLVYDIVIPDIENFVDVGTKMFSYDIKLYNQKGKDVTKETNLKLPKDRLLNLEIKPRPLEIKLIDDYVIYDEMPHSLNYTCKGLVDNQELQVYNLQSYQQPGEYEITISPDDVYIKEKNSFMPSTENLRNNYKISVKNGTLIIEEEGL